MLEAITEKFNWFQFELYTFFRSPEVEINPVIYSEVMRKGRGPGKLKDLSVKDP